MPWLPRVLLSTLLFALCALRPGLGVAAPTLLDPELQIEAFVSGLSDPTALAWLGADDLLVTERLLGNVRRVSGGVLQPSPIFILPEAASGDAALLGVAVGTPSAPGSTTQVFLFVEDRTGSAGNRVDRYDWNPATGLLEAGVTIFAVDPSGAQNADDGGKLVVGPPVAGSGGEPVLYVVSGYRELPGQLRNDPLSTPPDNAGVIARLLFDGSPVPGNPFTPYCSSTSTTTCASAADCPGTETCTTRVALYYAYGVRNSFGMAIDPVTGLLWDEENGDTEYDEINLVEAGMNSGWLAIMGPGPPPALFDIPGAGSTYSEPEYSWFDTTGPTGIAFAYGSSFGPDYDDKLLVADFNAPSQIYALPLNAARDAIGLADRIAETQAELDAFRIATDFSGRAISTEFGPDGHLYVISLFDGIIYRIRGPGRPAIPTLPPLALATLATLATLACALSLSIWLSSKRGSRG